jgi:MFS family permease
MHRAYLFIAVFFSGMASLAVEMAASRLIGNYFGASNLVWASIIGLILIYLTAGYFLGGYWADRSPHQRTFYQILAWGAFAIGLVPAAARPVLRFAANAFDELQMGILFGSFVTVMVLFIIPITLLGTASPFAIRLAIQDPRRVGAFLENCMAFRPSALSWGPFSLRWFSSPPWAPTARSLSSPRCFWRWPCSACGGPQAGKSPQRTSGCQSSSLSWESSGCAAQIKLLKD